MRQKLLAIRAHLARVPTELRLENNVRETISQAELAWVSRGQTLTENQTRAGSAARYYKASPEDVLEEVFDQYASDDVAL